MGIFFTSRVSLSASLLAFVLRGDVSLPVAAAAAKACQNFKIPVTVTSENYIFGLPKFQNNYDLMDVLTDIESRTFATDFHPYSGAMNQTASFVDHAIAHGYSVFTYDRLGVGASSKVSGYVSQPAIQVAVLQDLVRLVRSGQNTTPVGVPKSLVLMGHSFGSILVAAAATSQPDLTDGLILISFSYNGTNIADLDTGYITTVDFFADGNTLFKKSDYDVNVVEFTHDTRAPFAIAELISLPVVNFVAAEFKGALQIITGKYDFIFCTGNCDGVIEHPAAEIFAQAKTFEAISYPKAGHHSNFAFNAQGAYGNITDFRGRNGF
ncbi:hypothetical protein MMC19_003955 [Ptychographa xylographoides]|nr:hypothetical protein [Ptychographa xylographoides]